MATTREEIERRAREARRGGNPRGLGAFVDNVVSPAARALGRAVLGRGAAFENEDNNNVPDASGTGNASGRQSDPVRSAAQPNRGQTATTDQTNRATSSGSIEPIIDTSNFVGTTAGSANIAKEVQRLGDGQSQASFTGQGIPEGGRATITGPSEIIENPSSRGTFSVLNLGGGEGTSSGGGSSEIERTRLAQVNNARRINQQVSDDIRRREILEAAEQRNRPIERQIRDLTSRGNLTGAGVRAVVALQNQINDNIEGAIRLGEDERGNRAGESIQRERLDLDRGQADLAQRREQREQDEFTFDRSTTNLRLGQQSLEADRDSEIAAADLGLRQTRAGTERLRVINDVVGDEATSTVTKIGNLLAIGLSPREVQLRLPEATEEEFNQAIGIR